MLEHDTTCPPQLRLDPCLTWVALSVLHRCRLRMWPSERDQQAACKGVFFKGIVTGEGLQVQWLC